MGNLFAHADGLYLRRGDICGKGVSGNMLPNKIIPVEWEKGVANLWSTVSDKNGSALLL